ncbi:unnamed protein product [Cladocopium goreaui]|uniref:Uncharacterized protein n=1 Tax=Cladocopium goreaui TaxID=2562237 RepID=A0A9P1D2P3_9DINO|nr:unnamed protein product [Cladocopium goreaui]
MMDFTNTGDGSGSELGSDLDDDAEQEPKALVFTKVARLIRLQEHWSLRLKEGVLKVNDMEIVFSAGSVQLDFPEVRGNLQVVRDLWGLGVTCCLELLHLW